MSGKSLGLVGGAATTSGPLVESVLALWPEDQRPPILRTPARDLLQEASRLKRCGMIWLLPDENEPALYDLIALLQDRQVPAMITRPGCSSEAGNQFQEGVVNAPAAASASTLCAILRTLWSQVGTIASLQHEVQFLHAHQGGLCDQIDKIDEELRLAAQLQREFLPRQLPDIRGVEFRVLFRPAGYVSGDIYDVVRLDEEHVGLFVADAVGHGVPAALLTMYIKRSLHTRETDPALPRGYRIVPPDQALAQLNQDMLKQQSGGQIRFATACYGVLNCRTLELSFARAGHPFPLLMRGDGRVESITVEGGMLGVFPEETYDLYRTRLNPGDRLLLYSDGFEVAFPEVVDSRGRSSQPDDYHYSQELHSLAQGSLADAVEHLESRLDQAAGSLNQRDDLTCVCLGISRGESVETAVREERAMMAL